MQVVRTHVFASSPILGGQVGAGWGATEGEGAGAVVDMGREWKLGESGEDVRKWFSQCGPRLVDLTLSLLLIILN